MPFDGRALSEFSWDPTGTAVEVDYKSLVRSFTVERGYRVENFTTVADSAARYEAVKPDPSITAEFRIENSTALPMVAQLVRGTTGQLQIVWPATAATGSTTTTLELDPAIISDVSWRYDEDTGVQVASITFRPQGTDLSWS